MMNKIKVAGLAALLAFTLGQSPAQASVPDWDLAAHHHIPAPSGSHKAALSTKSITSLTYVYAGGEQVLPIGTTADGATANMLITEPYLDSINDAHSLMEVAVRDTATGNAVEIGATVDPGLNGDSQVHLFTGAWLNGAFLGYNASPASYVDYGGNPINAGANLHAVATSATFSGRFKKLLIQHATSVACGSDATGGWWVYYDNVAVGCYKNSAWAGAFTTVNNAEYFSEVVTTRASGKPCSDAGNGKMGSSYTVGGLDINDPAFFASTSWAKAPTPPASVNTLYAHDSNGVGTSAMYDSFSIGSTGNRSFTLGGEGADSAGNTPGNLGSC